MIGSQSSIRRGDTRTSAFPMEAVSGIGWLRPSTCARGKRRLTAVADARPGRVGRHGLDVAPASLALHAVSPLDDDGSGGVAASPPNLDLRHYKEHGQVASVRFEKGSQ